MIVIEGLNLCKKYNTQNWSPFKRFFSTSGFRDKKSDFWALHNVNFEVKQGSVFGVIGPNGAGKSTILKILARVTFPDRGQLKVAGRIAPMIELSAGFHTELTGRENIFLNGALMGLTKKQVAAKYDRIVEFSELADFIDMPIVKYSSGMMTRLGFSVAVHTDADILLVDEVLAVGDESFQRKCLNKFLEFRNRRKTVVFVSHDLGLVSNICDEVMLLNKGKVVTSGPPDSAMGSYLQMLGDAAGTTVVKYDDLVVIFNNGKAMVYWKNMEITKRFGLYTSMLISQPGVKNTVFWNDSTRAVWKCITVNDRHIKCVGEFFSFPIVQQWDLEFISPRHIRWSVLMEVKESVFIEKYQANAMISEKYDNWRCGAQNGRFPPDFTTRDYHNWDILCSADQTDMVATSDDQQPDLQFQTDQRNLRACVVNSDFHFRSRVLTFAEMEPREFSPGMYNYFTGAFLINTTQSLDNGN